MCDTTFGERILGDPQRQTTTGPRVDPERFASAQIGPAPVHDVDLTVATAQQDAAGHAD